MNLWELVCLTHISILGDSPGKAPVHGHNSSLVLPFTFCPSRLFSYCFPFFSKKICLLFSNMFRPFFLPGRHSGNMHISTHTISTLKYLLLNNIPSEGCSADDNGSHFLLWFFPVNLSVISTWLLFLAPI